MQTESQWRMTDSFEYDLSVDTESITFNESNKSASVTLVNQERAEDEDEETEEEEIKEKTTKNTPTPTSSVTPTKSTQTTNAVKTGDNTPIGMFRSSSYRCDCSDRWRNLPQTP